MHTQLTNLMRALCVAVVLTAGCAAPAQTPDFTPEDFSALPPILTGAPIAPAREPITSENAQSLVELGQLAGFGAPKALALSPDGQTLIVGTSKGAYLHDTEDLSFKGTLAEPLFVEAVAVSSNGRLAALERGGIFRLYPLGMGMPPAPAHVITDRQFAGGLTFLPDSATLVWISERSEVSRWALGDAQPARVRLDKPEAWQSFPWDIAFSTNAEQMALATEQNNVHLWRTRDGAHLAELPIGTPARAVRFSPAGDRLAVSLLGGQVQLWDLETQTLLREWTASSKTIYQLAFSPDGSRLATVNTDGNVAVWQVADGGLLDRWQDLPGGIVIDLVWLPDNERLAVLTTSHLLQLRRGQSALARGSARFVACYESVLSLAFSADGGWIGAVCKLRNFPNSVTHLYLWRAADGALVRVVNLQEGAPLARVIEEREPDAPVSAALSADLQLVVLGFAGDITLSREVRRAGGAVQLRRADGRVLHTLRGHSAAVQRVAISPDAQTLASGDADGKVLLWRARDGFNTHVLRLRGGVEHLAFSPDGKLLAAATRAESRVWRVADGTPLRILDLGVRVAFTSDSQAVLLLTQGQYSTDQLEVQRWSLGRERAGEPVERLTVFNADSFYAPTAWALAPNDQLLVVGDWLRVKLYNVPTGAVVERHPLRLGAGAAFSADGAQLLNIDTFGQLWLLGVPK